MVSRDLVRRSQAWIATLSKTVLLCGAVLCVGAAWTWAVDAPTRNRPVSPSAGPAAERRAAPGDRRIREGTEIIDQGGYFRETGDRMTFFTADGTGRFVALENLNLQRISKAIAEGPDKRLWKVSGVITEYREGNYLLVRRAILKN